MGHRGLSHGQGPGEPLVVGRLSGVCGWAHLASCSRSPFSSITDRTSVGCEWRPARRYLPFNSISLAQSARTREGFRLGALLTSVHKPNSWSRLSDNCLEDRQSLASAGVLPSRWAVAGDDE